MRFQTIIISAILILLALTACRDKGTEPYVKSIWLSAEDIGVTDASIHVILSNDNKSSNFSLKLNGNTILCANARDTLIFSDSLLPKHTYTYKAYRLNGSIVFDSSDALTITTMDTTSHNFTWQIDTLGDGNSSVLNDVAIINDTLAYAVGEIYKKDSTGNFETEPYGVAKWNGKRWELIRLYAVAPQGYNSLLVPKGVFVFSESNIWIAGGGVFKWNGSSQYVTPYWINTFPGNPNPIWTTGQYAQKLWGISTNNLYVVGTSGALAHFDGNSWQKMESGTSVAMQDIWGLRNSLTGHQQILATVCPAYGLTGTRLLSINENNSVDTIPWVAGRGARSIWFDSMLRLYVCGDGVFRREPDTRWREIAGITLIPVRTERLRGRTRNDLFVVGNYGAVAHFNGLNFKLFPEAAAALVYTSLDFKGNQMVAVGYTSSNAIVLHMRR
jgi:hypothetical protein